MFDQEINANNTKKLSNYSMDDLCTVVLKRFSKNSRH